MNRFESLFKPLAIKGLTLRNRIVLPPMNSNFAEPDGSISQRFEKYYVERGRGGAGLLIVSSAYIDPAAKKRSGALLLHDDRFIPRMRDFTSAIHATGAKVFQQINHNGRLLTSSKDLKTAAAGKVVGPSPVPHLITGEVPHVLTTDEIEDLVEKFGQAGRRAKEAGFDGVEIHGTHGYLINQFFSVYSNRRTDPYGGTLENRMRFPLEVYRRVRELTGKDFLICFRFNAREYAPVETPQEDVITLCQRLEREGVDLLHMSVGNSETPSMVMKFIPFGSTPRGCYADLAAVFKTMINVPLIAVARINTPEIAERILREGKADLVAIGRGLIADPYWPEKARRGEPERIRRCIACNQGCMDQLVQERPITCVYNPEVGHEGELQPPSRIKEVWVVGGGPGGMEAARVSAMRGHRVKLFEKTGQLGGQSRWAAIPPGKGEFLSIREYYETELKRLQVELRLNEEAGPQTLIEGKPDAVILATGALPLVPEIPGVKEGIVVTAWDVLRGRETGLRVVVVGAGMVGVETALFLSNKRKEVILIEMLEDIGRDAGPLNRARLREELKETKMEVRCQTELLRIGRTGITVRGEPGEYEIPAETVVLAIGAKSQNPTLKEIEGKISEVYSIGDCVSPRKILEAVQEGYEVASRI